MVTYARRLAKHARSLEDDGTHSPSSDHSPGDATVATDQFLLQYQRLSLVGLGSRWVLPGTTRATFTGTSRATLTDDPDRLTLEGTGRVVLTDLAASASDGSGGVHPNLATHDALGLATDTELAAGIAAHAAATDPHPTYASSALDPGSITIATERFLLHYTRLKLASTERLAMEGTARIVVDDFSTATDTLYLGSPKTPSRSFTVPTDHFHHQLTRLTLVGPMRATLEGTADLVLTDDFGTRSRLVLAGRG